MKQLLLATLLFIIPCSLAYGTVYTATTSGDWSTAATWGGTAPGSTIDLGDEVIIPSGITVNLDQDVVVSSSTSTIEVSGELTTSTANSITVNSGSLAGTGDVSVEQISIASAGVLVFTGNLDVGHLSLEGTNVTLAAQSNISDTLTISNGALVLQSSGQLELSNDTYIVLNSGDLVNNGGILNAVDTINLAYFGSSSNTGLETTIGPIGNVHVAFDAFADQLYMVEDLVINGTLKIDKGYMLIGNADLTITGDVVMGSSGFLQTLDTSSLHLETNNSLSTPLKFTSNNPIEDLTIDVGSGNEVAFDNSDNNIHVNGTLNFTSGNLNIEGQTLTVNGDMNVQSGVTFHTNSISNLIINTPGNVSGTFEFSSTGISNYLGELAVDMDNTDSITIGSELTITDTLRLDNGNIAIGANNLILDANAEVKGGSKYSYVQTTGSGALGIDMAAGNSADFFVGTAQHYGKATLEVNSGSNDGNFYASVFNDVYANGTTGADISDTADVTDQAWNITTDATGGVDVDLTLNWEAVAEANNFDSDTVYISKYTGSEWDASTVGMANFNPDTTYGISRSNIESLGPFTVFSGIPSITFTAVQSGDWSAAATWGGTAPGSVLNNADQVIIPAGIDVNLDHDLAVASSASSMEVMGTLSSNNDHSIVLNSGTITGTGTINAGALHLEAGGTLAFGGTLELNSLYVNDKSLAVAAVANIQDTLSVSSGALSVQLGAGLNLSNGATVKLSNSQINQPGVSVDTGGAVNLYYTGTTDTASGELMIGTINNVTVDLDNASDQINLSSNLVVQGTLNVNNGTLNLNGNGMSLRTDLMLSASGNLMATGQSSMSLKTSGSLTSAVEFKNGADTLHGLTIDVGSGNEAAFDSDVTVSGTFNLTSGTMNIQGQTLAVNGNLNAQANGELSTDNQTNLSLTASGNVTGAIHFNSSNNTVGNLVVDLGSSDSVSIGSDVMVDGTLQLDNGNIAIGANNLMLTANASVQGGSKSSYVQTTGKGALGIDIAAGNSSDFFVGTAEHYGKATIDVNSGSNDGNFYVSVFNDVYANGTTGADISDTADVTDQTWDITTDAAGSVDVNLTLNWETEAEVNNFDNSDVYISHYTNGSWDATAAAQANFNPDTTYGISRNNIQELSPFTVYSGSSSQATTYTAVASGNWSAGSTWDVGTSPGAMVDAGDEVIIPTGMSVTLDTDVTINDNNSSLSMAGELQSSGQSGITVAQGTISGAGIIDVHELVLHSSAALTFAGNLTVNTFTNDGASLALAAITEVEDTLWIKNNDITLQTASVFNFNSDATIILEDAGLINASGTINSSGSTHLVYKGGSNTTSDELSVSSAGNVTVDLNSSSDELMLDSDLTVNGALEVNSGTVVLGSNSLSLEGDYMASANGSLSANDQSDLMIGSSGSLSSAIWFNGGSDTLNNLTIDLDAGSEAKFDSDVQVNGAFELKSGTMAMHGQNLSLNGSANAEANGQIAANNNTNLWIMTSGHVGGKLNLADTANTVNELVINFDNNSDTIGFGSEVVVDGMLELSNGKAVIDGSNLMVTANASVQGGGPNSYVQTNGDGMLSIYIAAGNSADYPIGTAEAYGAASVELNSGSSDGNYMVNLQNDVWAQGSSGTDISASESVVDHTWDITTDASGSVDANLALTWEGAAEVNSFDNQNCYIAHYTGGSWDANATASATANANGTFTITRDNVTSLSPFAVFDENTSVGIDDEITAQDYIEMYPNPAKHSLHIESSLKDATAIQIYSINGQLMKTVELNQGHNEIDLEGLNNGTYYLHISGKEAGLSFIKQ